VARALETVSVKGSLFGYNNPRRYAADKDADILGVVMSREQIENISLRLQAAGIAKPTAEQIQQKYRELTEPQPARGY
jgi:cyclopropane fatty-acyl-phospholipid synthase-like methyltransferase